MPEYLSKIKTVDKFEAVAFCNLCPGETVHSMEKWAEADDLKAFSYYGICRECGQLSDYEKAEFEEVKGRSKKLKGAKNHG